MLNDRFVEKDGKRRRQRSYLAAAPTQREWVVVDAAGKPLGRLASQAAAILRGKHKATFTPHVDMGDGVIVINAGQVVLTGRKRTQKVYRRYTGYPGGMRTRTARELMERDPAEVVRRAVLGMVPHTRLGDQMRTRLRVYAGPEHEHSAQQPRPLTLKY
jgi:large subunit ribosomal protein L13